MGIKEVKGGTKMSKMFVCACGLKVKINPMGTPICPNCSSQFQDQEEPKKEKKKEPEEDKEKEEEE